MCVVIMDATSTHSKSDCLRRTTKPGAGLRWRLLRVSAEVKEGAHRVTDRRRFRREQQQRRRLQAANVAAFMGGFEGKKQRKQAAREENPAGACVQRHPAGAGACVQRHPAGAGACVQRHPAGAMAPQNTTQYLMTNTYEDLQRCRTDSASEETNVNDKSLPDRGDATAQDSDFDRYLAFLQRDFEEAVSGLCW